jgi:hypothetical protein|tara:strand:- start:4749 stop:5375 length:627 start_codon:yes stop_codon:yes gene_type:complete
MIFIQKTDCLLPLLWSLVKRLSKQASKVQTTYYCFKFDLVKILLFLRIDLNGQYLVQAIILINARTPLVASQKAWRSLEVLAEGGRLGVEIAQALSACQVGLSVQLRHPRLARQLPPLRRLEPPPALPSARIPHSRTLSTPLAQIPRHSEGQVLQYGLRGQYLVAVDRSGVQALAKHVRTYHLFSASRNPARRPLFSKPDLSSATQLT